MDRNPENLTMKQAYSVALRKESVDRNPRISHLCENAAVALRKESVDRNVDTALYDVQSGKSLSARRAWIEIRVVHLLTEYNTVALRKESVDRNHRGKSIGVPSMCRSPQGERG